MAEPVALLALAVDAAIGWPLALYRQIGHPVGLFARIVTASERRFNDSRLSETTRHAAGVATVAVLLITTFGTGWALDRVCRHVGGSWWWIGVALLAAPALAQRSLDDHVRPVRTALLAGDLSGARAAVARIVGRDTATLDDAGVARAAIESLAESFCDGVVAPLLWLLALGLPGVWGYKALNTADSLIGHREPRWRAFGWAAARADDVANLVPARLAGMLLCLCGRGGWRVLWRDHSRHASPNAGWPEAAMAGALGVRLAGPIAYDGVVLDKPWIGDDRRAADAEALQRALTVYRRACVALWLVAGGLAWAL